MFLDQKLVFHRYRYRISGEISFYQWKGGAKPSLVVVSLVAFFLSSSLSVSLVLDYRICWYVENSQRAHSPTTQQESTRGGRGGCDETGD